MKKFFLFAAAAIAAVTVNAKVVSFAGIIDKSSADAAKSSCEAACDFENLTAAGLANSGNTAYCAELTQTTGTTEWGITSLKLKSDSQVYFEFKDKNDNKKVAKFWADYFQPSGKAVCLVITGLSNGETVTLNLKEALNKETRIEGATVESSKLDATDVTLTAAANEIRVYSTNVAGDADAKWKIISVAIGEGGDDPGDDPVAGSFDGFSAESEHLGKQIQNGLIKDMLNIEVAQASSFDPENPKFEIKCVTGGVEGTFSMGGVVFAYKNSSDNQVAFKTFGTYIQPNGKDREIRIPVTAGDKVRIVVVDACAILVDGASQNFAAGENFLTATKNGNIVLKIASDKPKIQAILPAGGTQGFDALNATPKAVKRIINGQVVIVKEDGRMFNLLGAEITL